MSAAVLDKIRERPWPWVIFAVAFLARLIYIIEKSMNDPAFAFPMVDELWHWRWASEILSVSFWGDDAYFRAPLYPYFLALLTKLTGFLSTQGEPPFAQLFAIRTLQAALAAGTATLVYHLGREQFSQRVGAFAGLAYALYGPLIFYETMLLIPVLYLFLLAAALLWFTRWLRDGETKLLVYAGLLFGLSAIARPNILLVMPLLAGLIFFRDWNKRGAVAAIIPVALLAVATAIPVLSVTLRNKIVTGEATLIAVQGGVNLYLGNNPEADGFTMSMPQLPPTDRQGWSQFQGFTKQLAEREAGRALTPQEESDFWSAKAWDFITENPGQFLALCGKKLYMIALGFENSDNGDIYQNREYSRLMSLLLWRDIIQFPWGVIFTLGLIGLVVQWGSRRELAPLLLILLGYLPTVFLFLVTARHRLPIVLLILPFAGAGLFYLADRLREKKPSLVALAPLALVILLFPFNRVPDFLSQTGFAQQNVSQIYRQQGIAHERAGNYVAAQEAYERALEVDSLNHVLWNDLGAALWRQNREEEAATCFQTSTNLDSAYIEALLNYGQMLMGLGGYDRARAKFEEAGVRQPEDVRPLINIGDIHARLGEFEDAERT
ncbi:MAG TPA: tetratricopeptide repeat protein, partial [candidate division Zixibacteria bacterium]|nr:tetratricopeptide repeat protein [candidate division Zixibacteria bacterium]